MIKTNKISKVIFSSLVIFSLLLLTTTNVLAQGGSQDAGTRIWEGVVETGVSAGLGDNNTDLRLVAARIIYYLLGFMGILLTAFIMYGGWVWMTAGGNEEKVAKSKKILTNSAIGLLIVIVAYSLTKFVFEMINNSIQNNLTL